MSGHKRSVATFFVANPGHHTAMVAPVVRRLTHDGRACRVLSLCELRGLPAPTQLERDRVPVTSIVPFQFRRPGTPSAGGRSGAVKRTLRRGLRGAAWRLLRARIDRCIGPETGVAVLPNDAAYPYDEIAALLRARRVPFVLLQEGVRFRAPGAREPDDYGRGGAAAVAAWGESSAAYFRAQGVPEAAIHLTGNPRFDDLDVVAWRRRGAELRRSLGLDDRPVVAYLSNPVEHLGLVGSTGEKLALFQAFCAAVASLGDARPEVVIRLHASEPSRDFERIAAETAPGAVRFQRGGHLYELLAAADAAVVLASTAGIEALLFDLPLAVVRLPGGYAFDYVDHGAAIGLGAPGEIADNLAQMVRGREPTRDARERYLARCVAVRSGATERVAELVERCARAA